MASRLTALGVRSGCCLPIILQRAHFKPLSSVCRRVLLRSISLSRQHTSVPPSESTGDADLLARVAGLSPKAVEQKDAALLCQLSTLLSHSPKAAKDAWDVVGVVSNLIKLQSCGLHEVEEQARHSLSLLGYAPPYSGRGLRILSIDGGGTR